MSRQATATVDYFPHIVKGGKTIYVLESKFGNDGYAAWFKILELIGSTDGHYIDCRDLAAWEFLTAKCMVDEEKLLKIIQTLANVGAIDGELWKQKVIFCQNFINNVAELYKRRSVAMPTKQSVIEAAGLVEKDECMHYAVSSGQNVDIMQTLCPDSGQNVDKNPQSKVKESKVEETITTPLPPSGNEPGNISEPKIGFEEVVSLLGKICLVNSQVVADMIGDWIETMPRDWIENAIRVAKEQGGRSVKYVDAILQTWIKKYGLGEKPWEKARGKPGRNPGYDELDRMIMGDGDDDDEG